MRTNYLKTVYSGYYIGDEVENSDALRATSSRHSSSSNFTWRAWSPMEAAIGTKSSLRRQSSCLAKIEPFIVMDPDSNRFIYAWMEHEQYESLADPAHAEVFKSWATTLNPAHMPIYESPRRYDPATEEKANHNGQDGTNLSDSSSSDIEKDEEEVADKWDSQPLGQSSTICKNPWDSQPLGQSTLGTVNGSAHTAIGISSDEVDFEVFKDSGETLAEPSTQDATSRQHESGRAGATGNVKPRNEASEEVFNGEVVSSPEDEAVLDTSDDASFRHAGTIIGRGQHARCFPGCVNMANVWTKF